MKLTLPEKYWTGKPLFEAGLPWLTPGAIQELADLMQSGFTVAEFGGGGSTVFFARRCASVLCWESDPRWAHTIRKRLAEEKLHNVHVHLNVEPMLCSGLHDVVLVDSNGQTTDRAMIARLALPLCKPSGWYVLDNYARYPLDFLEGWQIRRFDDPHWSGRGTLIATQ